MSDPEQDQSEKDPAKFLNSVFDLTYGPAGAETLSVDEIRAELKAAGIDRDKGWEEMQAALKQAEGQVRLASARVARQKATLGATIAGGLTDTVESLREQIAGFLALSGGDASVYARKWENSSVEDLIALRNQLARTAARAAQRKDARK